MHDNPLFSTAADFVNNTSRHIFLTGKAGTGKTTFLKYIREHTRKKCVVVAPTGVAAMNAGGVTMHSFFQLPLGPFIPVNDRLSGDGVTDQYTLFKNIRVSEEKREIFRDLELLIIDEVSMVRADMLDATDAILRYFRKAPHTSFGGVQVLYIGDLFQLPPVMPDSQWSLLKRYYESPFFFHAKAIAEAPPVYVELKKIYRQSQQDFIDILNRIRNAQATRGDLVRLNGLMGAQQKPGEKYITLTSHNLKADRINADELNKLPGASRQFKGVVEGDFPEKTLPTEVMLELKVGAQVMFIRNDKSEERRYYNGKLATVTRIEEAVYVELADSGEEIELEQETWTNIRYSYNKLEERIDEEKLGSFTQYPIRLAWAITIHKSQGLTFQHAIIDAGDSFAPGQVYVALSRCTSLEGLILRSAIHPSSISTDPLVLEFATKASREEELTAMLQKDKRDYQNALLAKTFDFDRLVDAVRNYVQYLPVRQIPELAEAISRARTMLHQIEEQQKVALKFQQQMLDLLAADDEAKLTERVSKAIGYFSKSLSDSLLTPLDDHIAALKRVKKIKKYLKHVRELRNAVARKITTITKAQYGDAVFDSGPDEIVVQAIPRRRKSREVKVDTYQQTLAMWRQGMKPEDIAQTRGLALSTIESHMAELIKQGQIDITECMSTTKLDNILTVIEELKTDLLQPVKEKLGDEFTYGDIRAAIGHLHFSKVKYSD
ncbi:MAG TPA: helix-turn-helix domain-containing protein [Chryseosolibacter sp.]|nr:helix-turn-helix domain-containing protein [Chryseosolibacter sp.]